MTVEYLNLALDKFTWAGLVVKNYYVDGNTYGMTEDEMKEIEEYYGSTQYAKLKEIAVDDANEYDIVDTDNAHDSGWQAGEDATGFDGKGQGWNMAGTVNRAIFSAGGAVASGLGGKLIKNCTTNLMSNIGGKIGEKFAANATSNIVTTSPIITTVVDGKVYTELQEIPTTSTNTTATATETTSNPAAENMTKNFGAYVALTLGCINTAAYYIKNPNKEEAEACETLTDDMATKASESAQAQADMVSATEETTTLSENADQTVNSANELMANEAANASLYIESLKALQEKIANGEELTDSEKDLYDAAREGAEDSQANINTIQGETQEYYDENRADMEALSDIYSTGAETAANIQGFTDYAASFDKISKVNTIVEAASQGLNAASLLKASATLFSSSAIAWWNAPLAVLGLAAAAGSTVGVVQQTKRCKTISTEITARENTQTVNTATLESYETEVDNYNTIMDTNENLQMEVPEDPGLPELPQGDFPTDNSTGTSDNTSDSTDNKKKKTENDNK